MDVRLIGTREETAAAERDLRAAGWSVWEARRYETLHDGRVRVYLSAHPPAPGDAQERRALVTADLGASGTGAEPQPAPRWKESACRACYAPIIWGVTASGRRVCVDAEPVRVVSGKADCVLTDAGPDRPPKAEVIDNPARLFGKTTAYRRHINTCPRADYYRTKAAQRGAQQPPRGRR